MRIRGEKIGKTLLFLSGFLLSAPSSGQQRHLICHNHTTETQNANDQHKPPPIIDKAHNLAPAATRVSQNTRPRRHLFKPNLKL
ncbi:hypothetical protein B0T19DRAFT_149193 [Cercophora scortea]|uniref:Secreted protein n=1 Tax=Cercophora scortea TaxID=314031 RepID=A0AAE0IL57_9PEZI|nr:hypothetical protein B0T19DRAFT_149193 [Cercophora scortea]